LPSPIERLNIHLNSNGYNYDGRASIDFKNDSINIDSLIKQLTNKNTISCDRGILFKNIKQELAYSLQLSMAVGGLMYLKFGTGGVVKKNLTPSELFEIDPNLFKSDIKEFTNILENVVNIICPACPDINYKLNFN
jgi:hypothetical protein